MRRFLISGLMAAGLAGPAVAQGDCAPLSFEGLTYTVCEFDARTDDIRLFLDAPDGTRLNGFAALQAMEAARGERVRFAANAGMYHADYGPVGLFVEDGRTLKAANTNDGPGNFHLKPNGVFWIEQTPEGRRAHVSETSAYLGARPGGDSGDDSVRDATQSGPMLVLGGALHPRFLPDSTSRKRRNGVGVDGDRVVFAITEQPVTFHEFGRLFRDGLGTPDALYLDGAISQLCAPELDRCDAGLPIGPIVAVVAPAGEG